MDRRRRTELQIRIIDVTYRIERRRRDSATMRIFRERATVLMDELESEIGTDPDLHARMGELRRVIDEG